MADSSPLKILTPKRQKLGTDWEKCIVCQSQRKETLRNATDNSLQSFINAVSERRDEVFLRLENYFSVIQNVNVVWHRLCYQTCRSKTHIARSTIKMETEASASQTEPKSNTMFMRSAVSSFVQKTYCKREKRLHTCQAVDNNLQKAIEDLNKDSF